MTRKILLIATAALLTVNVWGQTWQIGTNGIYYTGGSINVGTSSTATSYDFQIQAKKNVAQKIKLYEPIIQTSGTFYKIGSHIQTTNHNITAGVTDNGYRMGLRIEMFQRTADFAGILKSQYGIWCRVGMYENATGIIENVYGICIDNMSNCGTINNNYGLYQSSSGAKNYFAGNVGIGTTTPDYKLDVLGTIRANEIKVETGWSDFVFEPDYQLMGLKELETYIQQNKHLPEIPTETEVKENGISLGEMNAKLLQKIEELTLYVIELKKENEEFKSRIEKIENNSSSKF